MSNASPPNWMPALHGWGCGATLGLLDADLLLGWEPGAAYWLWKDSMTWDLSLYRRDSNQLYRKLVATQTPQPFLLLVPHTHLSYSLHGPVTYFNLIQALKEYEGRGKQAADKAVARR